ncbi:MAG TPA: hypothetical protein VMF13_07495 [Luteitalea sp.]|nr:hypothetical protein [Luteitalea sp.]
MTRNWLLGLALCAALGCNAEAGWLGTRAKPPLPQVRRVPISFALDGREHLALRLTCTPTYRTAPEMADSKPFELHLVITEEVYGRVHGVAASGAIPGLPMVEVSGFVLGGRLRLEAFEVQLQPWTTLELRP